MLQFIITIILGGYASYGVFSYVINKIQILYDKINKLQNTIDNLTDTIDTLKTTLDIEKRNIQLLFNRNLIVEEEFNSVNNKLDIYNSQYIKYDAIIKEYFEDVNENVNTIRIMNMSLANITNDKFNQIVEDINNIYDKINNVQYETTLLELNNNKEFIMSMDCNIMHDYLVCNKINMIGSITSTYNQYNIIKIKCNDLLQYDDNSLDYNIYLIFNENELISHRYKLLNNIEIDDKIIMKNIINNYIAPHIIKLRV